MAQILNNTYEIIGLIGKGGMSTVFKARHIRLDIYVAIKTVRKDQQIDLLAEVRILKKLEHPNLVRIIDIFEDERLIYLVMDLIEGEDLQQIISREKVIPEDKVTEWFITLADTLQYLHSRKPPIIYRDMKPANVIMQKDGTLKLIDFGIAREYKSQATSDTIYIGTRGFAAPEQFGMAQSDARTDIYSLGMTMYYLATGKSPLVPPYEYVPAGEVNPEISKKLEAVLEKCLQIDPGNRYRSAQELHDVLCSGEVQQEYTVKLRPGIKRPHLSLCMTDTYMICSDGTVCGTGKNKAYCDAVSSWTDIVGLTASEEHVIGLKKDGTIVCTGENRLIDLKKVSAWTDIIAVTSSRFFAAGLKTDGTVVAESRHPEQRPDVSDWTDIIAVSASGTDLFGLRSDGRVVASGSDDYGRFIAGRWTDIVAISAGLSHIAGLRSDGTVVAVGSNVSPVHDDPKSERDRRIRCCEVASWTDITAVSAGCEYTVGLRSDGTVVSTEALYSDCDAVEDWKDVTEICCYFHTAAIRKDGTVLSTGQQNGNDQTAMEYAAPDNHGRCSVSGWNYYSSGIKNYQKSLLTAEKYEEKRNTDAKENTGKTEEIYRSEGPQGNKQTQDSEKPQTDSAGKRTELNWKEKFIGSPAMFFSIVILILIVWTIIRGISSAADSSDRPGKSDTGTTEKHTPLIWKDVIGVSAGDYHTVALKEDGTVIAAGSNDLGECDVSEWRNIVEISAGDYYTVGLREDGTVNVTGYSIRNEDDAAGWNNIISVAAADEHTLGLKDDGTVAAVGNNDKGQCNVSEWEDIISVSAGDRHSVGLRKNGTVVAAGYNNSGQCDVSDWTDIIAIAAGGYYTVGLKEDGTVAASGRNITGECDVSGWTDIIAVAAGDYHTVGLKADGTVVATGKNDKGACDVSDWEDIIAVSAGTEHTVGLKADGTLVAVGSSFKHQCNVTE
ncbi:MAG: protein kinase [Solobacterium sp.]|nr:protein kinase [Solobacterium sp.]